MCVHHTSTISIPQAVSVCRPHDTLMVKQQQQQNASLPNSPNPIKISVTLLNAGNTQTEIEDHQKSLPRLNLSPIYLQPPTEYPASAGTTTLKTQQHHHQLSSSFNCLSSKPQQNDSSQNLLNIEGGMRRFPPTSHSDSHLETHKLQQQQQPKNIFNFCQDLMLQQTPEVCSSSSCNTRRPPLSPFRARSPSPFPSSMDTPPSSPLTPVAVLYDLPAFLLTPILHWLYTESLMPDMNEDVCEKLINFAESQPSLMKLAEPAKKYLKMIKLKKCKLLMV